MAICVRVLGPLVLTAGDREVRLGRSLRWLALALLCARGQLVTADRLAVVLAEQGGEPLAVATVRSHVSHLRKALGDSPAPGGGPRVLVSGSVGGVTAYGLRQEALDIDATLFGLEVDEGLAELAEGRFALAAGLIRAALARWRGGPLADVADRPFAQDVIAHLEGRRRQAVTAAIAAEVGAGRHAQALAELERMIRQWADDENLRALLAVTRYRAGRPAGAAAACQDAIRVAQSHGLDSPRLHALQRDILSGTLPGTGLPHAPATW